jgi:hypothetical protein
MPKVRVHHPSSARAHRVERTVRWNQGTQGAFKRIMTVRVKARLTDVTFLIVVTPVLLFVERAPPNHVLHRLLYHQVLGRLHLLYTIWK